MNRKKVITEAHPMIIGPKPHTWIDAADESTVTLNGTDVAQINDKSGNGHNFNQTTPLNQPDYTATKNGHKIMTFDGTNHYLASTEASSVWKFMNDGSAFSIFAVVYSDDTGSTSQAIAYTYNTASANVGFGIGTIDGVIGAVMRPRMDIARGVGGTTVISSPAGWDNGFPRDQYVLIGCSYENGIAGNDASWYLSNALYGSTETANAPANSNPLGTMELGKVVTGALHLKGVIAELIIYDHLLSDRQINSLRIYFNNKWAL